MFTLSLHSPHLWIHLTPPATLRRVAAPSPGSGCQRPGLEAGLWTGFESSHVTCSMRVCKSSLRPGGARRCLAMGSQELTVETHTCKPLGCFLAATRSTERG